MKMRKTTHFILLIPVILFCHLSTSAFARPLKVAFGLWVPPYVIREEARGIEYDILKEILASKGYEMEPLYVPLARTLMMLKDDDVDGIMSTGIKDLPGCYTDSHITYWNYAISLKDRNLKINSVADLDDKSVVAFQNAKNYLGDDFHQMAVINPDYRELADQSAQNKLLYSRRVDVVIADRYIFDWLNNDPTVKARVNVIQAVTHHALFEPSHFSAVFKSDDICQAFNAGLKQLRASGRYQQIIDSYNVSDPNN
ncbi:MAG: transporter substrate-binding domain-containing protein [Rhodospirillaceae bacterium]|nr:transporter substrate-binding domain-containing protein [Rhodospirillaceae bacterium]MBL6932660.1 transporter substrate-binding domain-containing protein [Rhodospirillales bacterium]